MQKKIVYGIIFSNCWERDMDCLIANSLNNISCNLRAKVKCIFNTMTFNQFHVELPVLFVFLNIVKSKVVKFVLTRV